MVDGSRIELLCVCIATALERRAISLTVVTGGRHVTTIMQSGDGRWRLAARKVLQFRQQYTPPLF